MSDLKNTEPHDSPLRWLVPSKSNEGEEHLVDLGAPECTCRYWVTTVGPALRKGLTPRQYCSHYHSAKCTFTEWAIKKFKDYDKNKKET